MLGQQEVMRNASEAIFPLDRQVTSPTVEGSKLLNV